MAANRQQIPLPAIINKLQLVKFLYDYEAHRSFIDIHIKHDPEPLLKLRLFVSAVQENPNLEFDSIFELAKLMYDLELYESFHSANHSGSTINTFHSVIHPNWNPNYKFAKKVLFIKNFNDVIFGARSEGIRKLYNSEFYSFYDEHIDYKKVHKSHCELRSKFTELTFKTLCRIPMEQALIVANFLCPNLYSRSSVSFPFKEGCHLIPNEFDPEYINFLNRNSKKTPRNDYDREILYGYFWLERGKIATQLNKDKVVYYAEHMDSLTRINPNTEGLGEVEIQELYQNIFNAGIKKTKDNTKNWILSGARRTQTNKVLWKFFGENPNDPRKSNHVLCELKVVDHIMSFLYPR